MGTDMKGSILAHTIRENVKLEMLDIFIEMAGKADKVFTDKQKDFILDQTDKLVDLYDVSVKHRLFQLKGPDESSIKSVVPLEDVEKIIKSFRGSISRMIFNIIRLELKNVSP